MTYLKAGRSSRIGFEALENRWLMSSDFPLVHLPDLQDSIQYVSVLEFDPATGVERLRPSQDASATAAELSSIHRAITESGFDGIDDFANSSNTSTDQSPGAPKTHPTFAFSPDSRQPVGDTHTYPWRAIGRMWIRWNSGESWCSGAMIGPYHFLTAGHCVHQGQGGNWAQDLVVSAGQNGQQIGTSLRRSVDQFYGEAHWTYARTYQFWTDNGDFDWDVALVTLDRNVGNYTGWLGYAWNTWNGFYSSNTGHTAGYPQDLTPTAHDMWRVSGNAVDHSATPFQLRSRSIDTFPGQSGSPLYYQHSDGPYIHAIVSSESWVDFDGDGQRDPNEPIVYNSFRRMSEGTITDLNQWRSDDDGVRRPTDRPDLVDDDEWFNPNHGFRIPITPRFIPGQTISITAYPRNNGTAAANNYTVSFYASADTNITSNDHFLGSAIVNSTAPFTRSAARINVSLPNLPSGTYSVGWVIDSGRRISEFLENNNTGIARWQMNVENLPDLAGAYFDVSANTLNAWDSFNAQFRIRNLGGARSSASRIAFYLSHDRNIDTNDFRLNSYFLANLSGNRESATLAINLSLPNHHHPFWQGSGTYYLGMIVDADNNVMESNETNNSNLGYSLDLDRFVVNIDTMAPTADILDVVPNRNIQAVDELTIVFSEPVTGFDTSDLILKRDGQIVPLPSNATLSSTDNMNWKLDGLAGVTSRPGTYDLTLDHSTSNIADRAGNFLASSVSVSWTDVRSAGDANTDGQFDERDLVLVFAGGKFETVLTAMWSEGDWNGDGIFDTSDLVAALQTGKYRVGTYFPTVALRASPFKASDEIFQDLGELMQILGGIQRAPETVTVTRAKS